MTLLREPRDYAASAGRASNFKSRCGENGGYNQLTYTLVLTFFVMLMFITSVISTYLGYNRSPYRDWALAGGGGGKFHSPVIVAMRVYFHLLTFLTLICS